MVDNYIKITIPGGADEEALLGLLTELPFTGFEEFQGDLIGYMANVDWTEAMKQEVLEAISPAAVDYYIDQVPFENWNEEWEKNYPEVEIEDFCRIYAPFHVKPTQKFRYEILISPQMAFGTGHHATTEMMIRLMSHMPEKIQDKNGLDFGAGSGVLAILASKMGASHMDAVEIDSYAFQNLKENIELNRVDWIEPFEGGMEQVPESARYDFILANVTKNIILQHGQDFFDRLKPGGRILVSGILDTDQDKVHNAYIRTGFYGLESMKLGHWTALLFGKKERR
ncbi:50S ribosomal protein L11 methyltransferase [Membranicola marinus]|uniref:50S ribosomal protein L11 methyltransferase n=1 Tax=Membranihabitans marinus TaxID=1227546 RepID=A0A953L8N5_9BACT|nr:50S ribosomal protein L11 methyltransferase [Membranihabitans marinus]MBY5960012.1 50S ribosomal protein L11 methyltransferase [Membranihabitans marinus]